MREEILDTLRCQQCLGKLSFAGGKLVCNGCRMAYPISKGLIFMGYDKNEKNEVEKRIATKRYLQVNLLDKIQVHYDFAYPSFKICLLSSSILKHDIKKTNPIAIDIACGSAPMSKMLSENGFNAYRCELDPNFLYAGLRWKHFNLDIGKHIVCDATILPFRDNSVDVVFSKEFVHHLCDYDLLFMEINRVLKKDGIFLMIEPTLWILFPFLQKIAKEKEYPQHHYETINKYFSALKRTGFLPYRYYLYNYGSKRSKFLNMVRNSFHTQIYSMSETSKVGLFLKMLVQKLIDGSSVVFSRKVENMPPYKERPKIEIIEPSRLVLDENYLNDARMEKFDEILNDVYNDVYKRIPRFT